jgi:hypothetical protein
LTNSEIDDSHFFGSKAGRIAPFARAKEKEMGHAL